jgi:phosphatidylglycerol:prolipoprotein diacylglycerol transferase
MLAPHLNALAMPGAVRIGSLRFPVYGLFATAGLLAALALSDRTARRANVNSQKLWDAGIFAILAALVLSRLLLVAANFQIFRAVPMMVLTLPSLSWTGMLLTAIATAVFLRFKRVAYLRALDAWAAPACLLGAFLQLGHFFEGTDAGLPTKLPWGVVAPGDTVLGRTQPVQLYAAAIALLLTAVFYRLRSKIPGRIAAYALIFGGLVSFALDMLRQPAPLATNFPLDPSQFIAVAAIVLGGVLLLRAPEHWAPNAETSHHPEPHHAQ